MMDSLTGHFPGSWRNTKSTHTHILHGMVMNDTQNKKPVKKTVMFLNQIKGEKIKQKKKKVTERVGRCGEGKDKVKKKRKKCWWMKFVIKRDWDGWGFEIVRKKEDSTGEGFEMSGIIIQERIDLMDESAHHHFIESMWHHHSRKAQTWCSMQWRSTLSYRYLPSSCSHYPLEMI